MNAIREREGRSDPTVIDQLRAELKDLARGSALIHSCLTMGQIHRTSMEETLLRLAIEQEKMRKMMLQQLLDLHALSTRAHIIPVEICNKGDKAVVPHLAMPLNQDSING